MKALTIKYDIIEWKEDMVFSKGFSGFIFIGPEQANFLSAKNQSPT